MVLLILAAIWASVLIPPILRSRAEARPADSIGDFRRQLHVLQRTSPTRLAAANTLHDPYSRPLLAPAVPGLNRAAVGVFTADARRRRTQKRRRDVFLGLVVAAASSLVLSFIPALATLRVVHIVIDVLLVAYVGLLLSMRNAAAEREAKVRYLPQASSVEPALLLRRSGT